MPDRLSRLQGTIVLAQEHRFRLLHEDGSQTLCELGPAVPVGTADLWQLMDAGTHVEVEVERSGTTRACVVRGMWRLGPEAGARTSP